MQGLACFQFDPPVPFAGSVCLPARLLTARRQWLFPAKVCAVLPLRPPRERFHGCERGLKQCCPSYPSWRKYQCKVFSSWLRDRCRFIAVPLSSFSEWRIHRIPGTPRNQNVLSSAYKSAVIAVLMESTRERAEPQLNHHILTTNRPFQGPDSTNPSTLVDA